MASRKEVVYKFFTQYFNDLFTLHSERIHTQYLRCSYLYRFTFFSNASLMNLQDKRNGEQTAINVKQIDARRSMGNVSRSQRDRAKRRE